MNLAAIALLTSGIVPLHFYEQPDARIPYTFVAIRIALPQDMDYRDRTCAALLGQTLLTSGLGTTKQMVEEVSSDRGFPLRCYTMPNSLVIEMGCVPAELEIAETRLLAVISTTKYSREAIRTALDDISTKRISYWQNAADPTVYKANIDGYELTQKYKEWVRPERMSVCFTGTFPAGQPRQIWEKATRDWLPPVDDRPPLIKQATPENPLQEVKSLGTVSTVSFESYSKRQDPAQLAVACAMLGFGKGATAHQELREKYGLSYRQEAYVRPMNGGLGCVLSFAFKANGHENDAADSAKTYLLEAIDKWSPEDLARTQALLTSSVDQSIDLSLWWLRAEGYVEAGSPIWNALLTTEWAQDFGKPFEAGAFKKAFASVTLDQARACAKQTVLGRQVIVAGRA